MKIWIVKDVWTYDGCPDDYMNCYEENIEDIFDSEDKAIKCIQNLIEKSIQEIQEDDYGELYFDHAPTAEYIREHQGDIHYADRDGKCSYSYEEFEVK